MSRCGVTIHGFHFSCHRVSSLSLLVIIAAALRGLSGRLSTCCQRLLYCLPDVFRCPAGSCAVTRNCGAVCILSASIAAELRPAKTAEIISEFQRFKKLALKTASLRCHARMSISGGQADYICQLPWCTDCPAAKRSLCKLPDGTGRTIVQSKALYH